MCGIVAAAAGSNIVPVLIEGLKKLEYRGYDSAGLAVIGEQGIARSRAVGRIAELESAANGLAATTGVAHTRWATHGLPTERNAQLVESILQSEADQFRAVQQACRRLISAYDIAVIDHTQPGCIVVASQYCYRVSVTNPRQLVVGISQSGETAETLAALRYAKSLGQKKPGHLQRPGIGHRARMRFTLHHPRWSGNRCRLDQGFHHPACRALPAHAGYG